MTAPTATEWLRIHAPHLLPEHLRLTEDLEVKQDQKVTVEYRPQWSTRVELMDFDEVPRG